MSENETAQDAAERQGTRVWNQWNDETAAELAEEDAKRSPEEKARLSSPTQLDSDLNPADAPAPEVPVVEKTVTTTTTKKAKAKK